MFPAEISVHLKEIKGHFDNKFISHPDILKVCSHSTARKSLLSFRALVSFVRVGICEQHATAICFQLQCLEVALTGVGPLNFQNGLHQNLVRTISSVLIPTNNHD